MRALEICSVIAMASLAACTPADADKGSKSQQAATIDKCEARDKLAAQQLATFDDLDYNVFSNQRWSQLHESHAKDIKVHWPDGRVTVGIEPHLEDLKAMFVYAPDTRIKEHPIKIANGEWTAVMGIMEGTFTKPMPLPDGKTLKPTGKKFKLPMATLGHWNKNGVMDEEYLFWDNQAFMQQIGARKK